MITGQILNDRYEIQQQLGKKPGRKTFIAHDLTTQELVIIKLLSFNSDFEWDDLKLFEREAETLKSLSHPAIPRYLNYFEVNAPTIRGFALVQTYIPAQTLEQYLQSGRTFTEFEVKQIATAVLNILIYLHSLNPPVIHRDIKPSNILLGERSGNSVGQVYLVDFGSVQTVLATEGGTRTVVGTYGYMPPEQFGGRTVPASDLYSLGATLIYLATGNHPADLPQKDLRIQFDNVVNLSSSLTRWLKWLTEPSLDQRVSSANAALQALDDSHWQPQTTALTIGKPAGSKIQLTKSWDALEIRIPPSGFKVSMLFTGGFAIAWNSFILFWTIAALSAPFPANIPFVLFSLPFWSAGGLMVWGIVFGLFGSLQLRIDNQQVSFNRSLFGFTFHRPQASPKENISKLAFIHQHFTKDSEGNRTTVPAQLDIWIGVKKYSFGGKTAIVLSEAELAWLAHELKDWLDIPLSHD
ncbi:serine/threonine-protein kinase [Nostoc sp. FACHB-110]|uniref:serine/threonine protein kinase n=1 Tax=Nostoc sp. FACHB-110 TaxID=2692834 RepID=UPI0016889EA6|nr:serine/threonine-protein kinase [Nostoc sp. FACHB-110]MBD2435205.1 serine/threonine protein kinase [Nostoc sp. FACHB-110]